MSVFDPILASLKRFDTEALLDLRPKYPPVALEIDRGRLTLVRLRPNGRALPALEAFRVHQTVEHAAGATMFKPNLGPLDELARQIRELFAASGTKPGRVSLILPDNLAKVSIVTLPEKPANRGLLREMLRFKLRRSIPFRLEDAVISSHALPGIGPEQHYLVAVMLRSVVEQYEAALAAVGARPGLVDLCTPSLFNLVRPALQKAAATGADAALLNCTRGYFTLMIVRSDRVVFFRCKSYAAGEDEDIAGRLAVLSRELASSLSYYTDKLGGAGVGTLFVRSTAPSLDEVVPVLRRVGAITVRAIDATESLAPLPGPGLDPIDGQTLAPALGAAAGRSAA
jgi:Tfp pilus assembly PilM family ATPase